MNFKTLGAVTVLILALTSACVPVRVRTHGADELNPQGIIRVSPEVPKGYIGGTLYSVDHQGISGRGGVYRVEGNDNALEVRFSLSGNTGATIRYSSNKLRFRYAGGMWAEVVGGLKAEQIEFRLRTPPRDGTSIPMKVEAGKTYRYSRSGDANGSEVVTFQARIPKEERDLEIELPEIYIGSDRATPETLKFKWHDHSVLKPLMN